MHTFNFLNPGNLAIIMIFGIPVIAIIGGIFLSALKILKGSPGKEKSTTDVNETKMIQEIHLGLTRMEKRVETLETILLDRTRKEGN